MDKNTKYAALLTNVTILYLVNYVNEFGLRLVSQFKAAAIRFAAFSKKVKAQKKLDGKHDVFPTNFYFWGLLDSPSSNSNHLLDHYL
ncbi:hypothetical protein [Paenibacillus sp. IITD108]|uniref:hypothetical protein n=1 Tax=Paenibacillus sp. IITD108 TaxID=3116649 RepID=UPI002F40F298